MAETTSTAPGERRKALADAGVPQLILAIDCDTPVRAPSRHLLRDLEGATIGRGKTRGAARRTVAGERTLELRLDDRQVSEVHARVRRLSGNRWAVEDADSKNGIQVNGQRVRRALLLDGDVLEVGRTAILYLERGRPVNDGQPDVDVAELSVPAPELATFSAALAETYATAARAAVSALPVSLLGESGVGKEVLARAIHALSGRKGQFVAVNCGALPSQLVEATLFGHRRGAFSGAVDDNVGLVRGADKGTLLLDEIGDLPLPAQAALLRVLQEREVLPVGATRAVAVDARVIAATHRSLDEQVKAGQFRADLLARLAGIPLALPPLRERREDVGLLVAALLRRAEGRRADERRLTRAAARALLRHDWPANVRELERCLAAAAVMAGDDAIDLEHLPAAIRPAGEATTSDAAPDDERRRDELVALMIEHRGNAAAVARALGTGRMQVHRWLKRYGIDPTAYR